MKKLLAAIAALLVLSACSAKEPAPAPAEPEAAAPVVEPAPEEPPVTEVPMEIVPQEPAEEPAEPVDYTAHITEGLSGDAVGYSLVRPEFGQSEIDEFYTQLVEQMENHASTTVHDNCLERHCLANVSGAVTEAVQKDGILTITYTYTVEYSDSDEPVVNTRTDSFDLETGERSENN